MAYQEDGRAFRLDLFLAENSAASPIVLFVHGGAWITGDKSEHRALGIGLAQADVSVANINYRLTESPQTKHPVHVRDVCSAYAYIVTNSVRLGINPNQIYVAGHSAGAHNCATTATSQWLSHAGVRPENFPKGFIGLAGIYDLPKLAEDFPTYRTWFLEIAFGPDLTWNLASPSHRAVTIPAPWLLIHSTQDQLVNITQTVGFADHLRKSGVHVSELIGEYGDHDQAPRDLGETTTAVGTALKRFSTSSQSDSKLRVHPERESACSLKSASVKRRSSLLRWSNLPCQAQLG